MSWKEDLMNYEMEPLKNLDDIADEQTIAKNKDVGFVNPNNGVGIMARENGDLEGFADYGLGFRFHRETQSLSVFAPTLNLFVNRIIKQEDTDPVSFYSGELKDIENLLKGISTSE